MNILALERAVSRLNPDPAIERQRREEQADWDSRIARLNFLNERSRALCAAALSECQL